MIVFDRRSRGSGGSARSANNDSGSGDDGGVNKKEGKRLSTVPKKGGEEEAPESPSTYAEVTATGLVPVTGSPRGLE